MATTSERLVKLLDENIEIEGRSIGDPLDLDKNITESRVASADLVALWRLVNEEFGVEISREQFAELLTPRELIQHLDGLAA